MRLKNTDVVTRFYNDLQRPDGRTLELEPSEEADVDVPESLTESVKADPFLKIVSEAPKRRGRADASSEPEQGA